MNRRFGKNDILLLTAVLIVTAVGLILLTVLLKSGERVVITVDGADYGTYSLKENQDIDIAIDGRVTNVLRIEDGKAHMIEADCPDKLCMHQAAIDKDKETIVCLPNKIVVTVESSDENEFDSMAR